ncbi:MAG: translation initiation factor IF-2 subunit alpha [Candidatus Bathyarchaeia archaeon]
MAEPELPEVGDLIIGTVVRLTDYGAYVTMDEYQNMDGFLHISEIASSWVKNIRDFVREKQKVVLKVLRVETQKKQIDVSLRRVSGKERQDKLLQWKRKRKVISILEVAAVEAKVEPAVFLAETLPKIEEKFDDLHSGLEEMIEKGTDMSERLKIPTDWITAIVKTAQQKVKLPTVKIKNILELTCPSSDGVNTIKKILIDLKTSRKSRKTKTEIYSLGAPRYVVEITAKDYKDAEKVAAEITEYALGEIKKAGGYGKFSRSG